MVSKLIRTINCYGNNDGAKEPKTKNNNYLFQLELKRFGNKG